MDPLLETPRVASPPATPLPKKQLQRKRRRTMWKRTLDVKDCATLNSFLRKLPSQHKKYKLPLTRGMTMASYLRRLGLKLGWNKVRMVTLLSP